MRIGKLQSATLLLLGLKLIFLVTGRHKSTRPDFNLKSVRYCLQVYQQSICTFQILVFSLKALLLIIWLGIQIASTHPIYQRAYPRRFIHDNYVSSLTLLSLPIVKSLDTLLVLHIFSESLLIPIDIYYSDLCRICFRCFHPSPPSRLASRYVVHVL